MYKYLFQFPEDRQMGWHNELQGVCHDKNNWYFSQHENKKRGVLWRFPVGHRIGNTCKEADPDNGILRISVEGYHFGDIDYYEGYVFVSAYDHKKIDFGIMVFEVEKDAAGKEIGLRKVMFQKLSKPNMTKFSSIGWCAVNYSEGRLYLSDKHCKNSMSSTNSPILVYDINVNNIKSKSDFLTYRGLFALLSEDGKALNLEHMQGGTFDNSNHLHLVNGLNGVDRSKSGVSVFKVSCINGIYQQPRRICKSTQNAEKSNKFRYQFDPRFPKYEEPEGITYWDLTDKRAPEIDGVLHIIMLDNGTSDSRDNFYFKHYNLL